MEKSLESMYIDILVEMNGRILEFIGNDKGAADISVPGLPLLTRVMKFNEESPKFCYNEEWIFFFQLTIRIRNKMGMLELFESLDIALSPE